MMKCAIKADEWHVFRGFVLSGAKWTDEVSSRPKSLCLGVSSPAFGKTFWVISAESYAAETLGTCRREIRALQKCASVEAEALRIMQLNILFF